MAVEIQREYSLPVVAVRLTMQESTPCVRLQLIVNVEGQPDIHDERIVWLSEFGYGATTKTVDSGLSVPHSVSEWVGGWARTKLVDDDPLWLHLVKPYGTLGAIPWERDLQPAVARPLLRLPDVFPDPEQSTTTYDLVFIATAPSGEHSAETSDALKAIARIENIRLHVFCDATAGSRLRDVAVTAGATMYHYDPSTVESSTYTSELRNPWFRWIKHSLAGQSVDAVHFVVHGTQLGAQGAIVLPYQPDDNNTAPTLVQAGELASFFTQVGALTASFTRPSDNYSDYGLRRVVDDLGSMRAGPVLLHEPTVATETVELTACYRFLADFRPAEAPSNPQVLLYTQPQHVRRPAEQALADLPFDLPTLKSASVAKHFERDSTPAWLGAAQRYIEQKEGELRRFQDSATISNPTEAAHYAGIEAGLLKVRAVVERHAEREL